MWKMGPRRVQWMTSYSASMDPSRAARWTMQPGLSSVGDSMPIPEVDMSTPLASAEYASKFGPPQLNEYRPGFGSLGSQRASCMQLLLCRPARGGAGAASAPETRRIAGRGKGYKAAEG